MSIPYDDFSYERVLSFIKIIIYVRFNHRQPTGARKIIKLH